MSAHWNPEDELNRVRPTPARPHIPAGSAVGLAVVAATCLSVAVLLYRLAGPRDIFGG
jgi:hypothetical protein